MADQLGLSLRDYRNLERSARLDTDGFRSATFAALRIAVGEDSGAGEPNTELFKVFDELLHLFERASQRSRLVH
jgi:hypothetical protein